MELQNDRYSSALPNLNSLRSRAYDLSNGLQPYHQPGSFSQANDIYSSHSTLDLDNYLQPQSPAQLETDNIHEQVFGGRLKQQEYTLAHLEENVSKRRQIHKKHIGDLQHRIGELQENLSIVKLHAAGPAEGEEIKLQSQIQQLEKQKRDEEIDYWKDAAEIKRESLETALQYESAKRRSGLFMGMEP